MKTTPRFPKGKGILTPRAFPFARNGIVADTTPDVETVAIADIPPEALITARNNGTVRNLRDRRQDPYHAKRNGKSKRGPT